MGKNSKKLVNSMLNPWFKGTVSYTIEFTALSDYKLQIGILLSTISLKIYKSKQFWTREKNDKDRYINGFFKFRSRIGLKP